MDGGIEQNPAYGTARTPYLQEKRREHLVFQSSLTPRFTPTESEKDADRFKKALGSVAGRRLTYRELTGNAESG